MTKQDRQAYDRAYYHQHREECLARSRQYNIDHRDDISAKGKVKRANLSPTERQLRLEKKRAYHATHRIEHREQQKKWRESLNGQRSRSQSRQRERQKLRDNPTLDQDRHLRTQYGMTLWQFKALVAKQGGKCSICGSARRLVVDHDHETDAFRGIICFTCNTGIGHIERFTNNGLRDKLAAYMKGVDICL